MGRGYPGVAFLFLFSLSFSLEAIPGSFARFARIEVRKTHSEFLRPYLKSGGWGDVRGNMAVSIRNFITSFQFSNTLLAVLFRGIKKNYEKARSMQNKIKCFYCSKCCLSKKNVILPFIIIPAFVEKTNVCIKNSKK